MSNMSSKVKPTNIYLSDKLFGKPAPDHVMFFLLQAIGLLNHRLEEKKINYCASYSIQEIILH